MCLFIIDLRRNDGVEYPIDQRCRAWHVRLFRFILHQMEAICKARRLSPEQANAILSGEASKQARPVTGCPPSRVHTRNPPPPYSGRVSGARHLPGPSLAATRNSHTIPTLRSKRYPAAAHSSPLCEDAGDDDDGWDDYTLFYEATNTACGLLEEH